MSYVDLIHMKDIMVLNKPVYEVNSDNYLAMGEGTFENFFLEFQVGIELLILLMLVTCPKHQATRMEGSTQLLTGLLCAHLT